MTAGLNHDRGAALFLALILTLVVSALGLTLLSLTNTEAAISANHAAGLQVLYAAEAGAARVRADLSAAPDWTAVPGGALQTSYFDASPHPVTPAGRPLDVAGVTAALQAETNAALSAGPNTPVWRLFASGTLSALAGGVLLGRDGYLLVWVADDPSESDGDPAVDGNGVVLIRADAIGAGGLRRSVQLALARVSSPSSESGSGELAQVVPLADEAGVRMLSWREVR
jgi:hypothetical protein